MCDGMTSSEGVELVSLLVRRVRVIGNLVGVESAVNAEKTEASECATSGVDVAIEASRLAGMSTFWCGYSEA